jgi:hypothetical protein
MSFLHTTPHHTPIPSFTAPSINSSHNQPNSPSLMPRSSSLPVPSTYRLAPTSHHVSRPASFHCILPLPRSKQTLTTRFSHATCRKMCEATNIKHACGCYGRDTDHCPKRFLGRCGTLDINKKKRQTLTLNCDPQDPTKCAMVFVSVYREVPSWCSSKRRPLKVSYRYQSCRARQQV